MKKIKYIVLLIFVFSCMNPIHAMLSRGVTRVRAPQSLFSRVMNKFSDWKTQFVRWYTQGRPLAYRRIAPPIEIKGKLEAAISPEKLVEEIAQKQENLVSVGKSDVQIESEDILSKLRGENPWDYPKGVLQNYESAMQSPLAKKIKQFLKTNDSNAIEDVFFELITMKKGNHLGDEEGNFILREIIISDSSFAAKILPLVEKYCNEIRDAWFMAVVLIKVPSDQHSMATNAQEKLFKTSCRTLIGNFEPKHIAKLLPSDSIKLISAVKNLCNVIGSNNFCEYNRERCDEIIPFLKNIIAEKITHVTDVAFEVLMQYLLDINTWDVGEQPGFERMIMDTSILKARAIDYVKKNIKQLLFTEKGVSLMCRLMIYDPSTIGFFADLIKNEKTLIPQLLKLPASKEMLERLASYDSDISEILYLKGSVFDFGDNYAQTPSYRHMRKYASRLHHLNFSGIDSDVFRGMINAALKKEKESMADYEIFYHGRQFKYRFLSRVYDTLHSHLMGRPLKNFSSTHFVERIKGDGSEKFMASEEQVHQRLLQEGNKFSWTPYLPREGTAPKEQLQGFLNRQRLLFLNKFLFGNINKPGSCSMYYILQNHNAQKIVRVEDNIFVGMEFTVKEIFALLGYPDVYAQFEQRLKALQQKHDNLTSYGELLQLLIPKKKVKECVYYTTSGGPKLEFTMPGGSTTADIEEILKYLDENPEDILEFVLINTYGKFGGLNPYWGLQVNSLHLVEPEKMAEYEKEEKQLLDEIEEACRQKDKKEKLAQVERE